MSAYVNPAQLQLQPANVPHSGIAVLREAGKQAGNYISIPSGAPTYCARLLTYKDGRKEGMHMFHIRLCCLH